VVLPKYRIAGKREKGKSKIEMRRNPSSPSRTILLRRREARSVLLKEGNEGASGLVYLGPKKVQRSSDAKLSEIGWLKVSTLNPKKKSCD